MRAEDVQRSPLVVGVDSSDSARHAAEWAADLASVWRVPLQLVNASAGAGEPATVAIPPWLRELVDAAERLGAEPAGAEVVAGGVADVLLDRSTGAGLVVVGSYGEGAQAACSPVPPPSPWSAARDVRSLSCGVRRGSCRRHGGGRWWSVSDGSPVAVTALDLAAELAAAFGARLVAVHAWTDVRADASGGLHRSAASGTELAARAVELLDTQLTPVQDRHPGVAVEGHVVNDTALRALLDQAREARTVVVGHRSGPAATSRLGSTSRGLVEFAPCPVVVA
jgi:nucleotide-binding universal stress UspA family protein